MQPGHMKLISEGGNADERRRRSIHQGPAPPPVRFVLFGIYLNNTLTN